MNERVFERANHQARSSRLVHPLSLGRLASTDGAPVTGPRALVLAGPGTNRDRDVALALSPAGAEPHTVLVDELVADPSALRRHDIVVVAGGFSYGDALGAGRLLALD